MNKATVKAVERVHEPKISADLKKVLTTSPSVIALWEDLTPISKRDFVTWIESAKQSETRTRRISITRDKLLTGKRRPCCYAVVPMPFYKALGENPKAKATWKELSAMEKRDVTGWVDEAKDKETNKVRIIQAIAKLESGKKKM
jgi:uncharacterized protein YdeI (YjbR/CyaY-like superfamily)